VRTKTVKKSARVIIEKYYSRLTLDFHTNKRVVDEVAEVPSKRMRNKIAGFVTHLMKRIQKGPVRGISLKLQEEERERRLDFVPEVRRTPSRAFMRQQPFRLDRFFSYPIYHDRDRLPVEDDFTCLSLVTHGFDSQQRIHTRTHAADSQVLRDCHQELLEKIMWTPLMNGRVWLLQVSLIEQEEPDFDQELKDLLETLGFKDLITGEARA
jgi:ribosomal protein S17E